MSFMMPCRPQIDLCTKNPPRAYLIQWVSWCPAIPRQTFVQRTPLGLTSYNESHDALPSPDKPLYKDHPPPRLTLYNESHDALPSPDRPLYKEPPRLTSYNESHDALPSLLPLSYIITLIYPFICFANIRYFYCWVSNPHWSYGTIESPF